MSVDNSESIKDFQAYLRRHLMASEDKGRYIIDSAFEKRENGTEKHLHFLRDAFEETGLSVYLFALAIYEGRWRLKVVTPPPLDGKQFPLPQIYRLLKAMPRLLYVNITATEAVLTNFFSMYDSLVMIPQYRKFWSDRHSESYEELATNEELDDWGQNVQELKSCCRELREFRDDIKRELREEVEKDLRDAIRSDIQKEFKERCMGTTMVEAKQVDIKMKRLTELERNVENALSEIEELPDAIERRVKRKVERQLKEEIAHDVEHQLKEFRNAMKRQMAKMIDELRQEEEAEEVI